MKKLLVAFTLFFSSFTSFAQVNESNSGWFSLGVRNTLNTFSHDGTGLGVGGQFRIQLSNQVNTDWFADYITIQESEFIKSEYAHIGWSVLFYPLKEKTLLQPYILAGHCFDYNKKSSIQNPSIYKDRWGSAVQVGLGTHINLTDRFDVSLMAQYMIHLTSEIEAHVTPTEIHFHEHSHAALEGHLLITASVNYKLFKLWKK
jgi:opacity protein-like surface antigen